MAPHSIRSTAVEAFRLSSPSIAALLAGVLCGLWLDAATAVALVLPATLVAHAATLAWSRKAPAGAFLGMLAGVLLRGMAIIGGGALLFFGTDWYQSRGMSLWLWVIGVYLSTLIVETVLLGRALRLSKEGGPTR